MLSLAPFLIERMCRPNAPTSANVLPLQDQYAAGAPQQSPEATAPPQYPTVVQQYPLPSEIKLGD